MRGRLRIPLLFLLLAFVNGIFVLDYLGDALGQVPVLDGRENLALAEQIGRGQLSTEPFYRAMLYPWVLSIVMLIGAAVPWVALFGFLLHMLSSVLVGALAWSLWKRRRAALCAGCLLYTSPSPRD